MGTFNAEVEEKKEKEKEKIKMTSSGQRSEEEAVFYGLE